MTRYLIQVAYSTEATKAMVKEPQNRLEAVRPAARSLGGDFESAWFCFGEYDLVGIVNMPNDVDAAAFALAIGAAGSTKAFRTTPLIEMDDAVEAMRKAQKVGYRPPQK